MGLPQQLTPFSQTAPNSWFGSIRFGLVWASLARIEGGGDLLSGFQRQQQQQPLAGEPIGGPNEPGAR